MLSAVPDGRTLVERGAAELGPDTSVQDVPVRATTTFAERMIMASNMQDAVLVDLATKALPEVQILFLETGPFARTQAAARASRGRLRSTARATASL